MIQILFLTISGLAVLATLGVVLARNLVHAALHLVAFFFLIACQFLLLEAEFLAAIQVLIYIGAVSILLMFGIMLTRNIQGDDTTTPRGVVLVPAALVCLGLVAVLCYGIADQEGGTGTGRITWTAMPRRPTVDPTADPVPAVVARQAAIDQMGRAVGDEMMSRFVLPFEVAGLLLTAALVGAIALARHDGIDELPNRTGAIATVRPDTSEGPGAGLILDGAGNGAGTTKTNGRTAEAPALAGAGADTREDRG